MKKKKPQYKDIKNKNIEKFTDRLLEKDAKQQALHNYSIDPNKLKDIFVNKK
jgi:hypothetical protein